MLPGDIYVELEPLDDEAIVVVRVKGALDRFTGPHLKDTLVRALEAGTNELAIDMSGVTSVDSSGLGVLVGTLKLARRAGGDLRLAGPNHKLATVLERLSLDQVLRQDETVQDAITYFRSSGAPTA